MQQFVGINVIFYYSATLSAPVKVRSSSSGAGTSCMRRAAQRASNGKNLTEWQFGLGSIKPRWNVSGTYMQAIPRFVSTDSDGNDEREFLTETIDDYGRLISLVFLKGYQWSFDARKAADGGH